MKAFAWIFASVALVNLALNTACGSKSDDKDETAPTSSYTYEADTKEIIDATCIDSGCHEAGSVNKPLTTLAEIKAVGAAKIIDRLNKATSDSLYMPKDNPNFASADKAILLDWLAGGADLK